MQKSPYKNLDQGAIHQVCQASRCGRTRSLMSSSRDEMVRQDLGAVVSLISQYKFQSYTASWSFSLGIPRGIFFHKTIEIRQIEQDKSASRSAERKMLVRYPCRKRAIPKMVRPVREKRSRFSVTLPYTSNYDRICQQFGSPLPSCRLANSSSFPSTLTILYLSYFQFL